MLTALDFYGNLIIVDFSIAYDNAPKAGSYMASCFYVYEEGLI